MKRLLHSLALLAVLVAPAAADAARPRVLIPHQLAPGLAWIGATDPATAAFATTSGTFLRPDDGPATSVPAPGGCGPSAAGDGLIAYQCGPSVVDAGTRLAHLAVTDAAGRELARVDQRTPLTNGEPSAPDAIGRQWIHTPEQDYHYYFDHYVNWRTGEVRSSNVADGTVADLGAPGLTAALCAPLKPVIAPGGIADLGPNTLPVTVRGRWVLIRGRDSPDGPHHRLYRCGSAVPVRLPAGFGVRPVLGDGWLADARHGDGIHLLRLADRRPFRVRVSVSGYGELHFSRGRLYVWPGAVPVPGGRWLTVRLPTH